MRTSTMRLLLFTCSFTVAIVYFLMPMISSGAALVPPSAPPVSPFLANGRPEYCSAPLSGREGYAATTTTERTLRAVAIVIRHGDRSAIHGLGPNATGATVQWRCTPAGHEGHARREWPALAANRSTRPVA